MVSINKRHWRNPAPTTYSFASIDGTRPARHIQGMRLLGKLGF
jgi:hypothetical protein